MKYVTKKDWNYIILVIICSILLLLLSNNVIGSVEQRDCYTPTCTPGVFNFGNDRIDGMRMELYDIKQINVSVSLSSPVQWAHIIDSSGHIIDMKGFTNLSNRRTATFNYPLGISGVYYALIGYHGQDGTECGGSGNFSYSGTIINISAHYFYRTYNNNATSIPADSSGNECHGIQNLTVSNELSTALEPLNFTLLNINPADYTISGNNTYSSFEVSYQASIPFITIFNNSNIQCFVSWNSSTNSLEHGYTNNSFGYTGNQSSFILANNQMNYINQNITYFMYCQNNSLYVESSASILRFNDTFITIINTTASNTTLKDINDNISTLTLSIYFIIILIMIFIGLYYKNNKKEKER